MEEQEHDDDDDDDADADADDDVFLFRPPPMPGARGASLPSGGRRLSGRRCWTFDKNGACPFGRSVYIFTHVSARLKAHQPRHLCASYGER